MVKISNKVKKELDKKLDNLITLLNEVNEITFHMRHSITDVMANEQWSEVARVLDKVANVHDNALNSKELIRQIEDTLYLKYKR